MALFAVDGRVCSASCVFRHGQNRINEIKREERNKKKKRDVATATTTANKDLDRMRRIYQNNRTGGPRWGEQVFVRSGARSRVGRTGENCLVRIKSQTEQEHIITTT